MKCGQNERQKDRHCQIKTTFSTKGRRKTSAKYFPAIGKRPGSMGLIHPESIFKGLTKKDFYTGDLVVFCLPFSKIFFLIVCACREAVL